MILSCPPKQIFFLPSPKAASLPHLLLQPLPGIEAPSLSFFKLYALSPDKCACLCENYPLDIEIAGKEKPLSAGFPAAFQVSTPTPWVVMGFPYIMVFVPHSKFVSYFSGSFLLLFYCFFATILISCCQTLSESFCVLHS